MIGIAAVRFLNGTGVWLNHQDVFTTELTQFFVQPLSESANFINRHISTDRSGVISKTLEKLIDFGMIGTDLLFQKD